MRNTRTMRSVTAVLSAMFATASVGLLFAASAQGATPAVAAAGISTPGHSDGWDLATETRATGHVEYTATGLHIWTEGATSTDKVAGYKTVATPLSGIGTPSMEWKGTSPEPGLQLLVDVDGNGTADGILVGEAVYGSDWWLSNSAAQIFKDGAPSHTGGSGSANHGTLAAWSTSFPDATVVGIGFSLGSGIKGDGLISAMTFAGITYTFGLDPASASSTPTVTPSATPSVTPSVTATVTPSAAATVAGGTSTQDPSLAATGSATPYVVAVALLAIGVALVFATRRSAAGAHH